MFFEVVGLAFCSVVLLVLAAVAGLFAAANYRYMFTGLPGLFTRLRWLIVAAASIVILICVLAAWISLLSGNPADAVTPVIIALGSVVLAAIAFFAGLRPISPEKAKSMSEEPSLVVYLPDLEDVPRDKPRRKPRGKL